MFRLESVGISKNFVRNLLSHLMLALHLSIFIAQHRLLKLYKKQELCVVLVWELRETSANCRQDSGGTVV
jgi:hypothetical protein